MASTLPCILFCSAFTSSDCIAFVCFIDVVDTEMETVLGEMEVELDGRFSTVRNTETNLGIRFVYDVHVYIQVKCSYCCEEVLQRLAIHTSYRCMRQTRFARGTVLGLPPEMCIGYSCLVVIPRRRLAIPMY